ncbi:MAG: hypothetical protein HC812_15275 [Leptolyngbya sp. RL_3_1]|nr:hypothetical protein [Leptolyngbya sp. RL_3_1]
MARFLHIADIHLGFDRYNSKARTKDFYFALADVLDRYAIQAEVDFVIICGDLFEQRMIQPAVLNQAQLCLQKVQAAGIPVLAIEGNHDNCPYGTTTSWLKYLSQWGLLTLLEPSTDPEEGLQYHPWDDESHSGGYIDLPCGVRVLGSHWYGAAAPRAIEQIAAAIAQLPPGPENTLLMFHHGLEGQIARYSGALRYRELLPLREVGVDYLALGHIHKAYSAEDWVFNPGSLEANNIEEGSFTRGAYLVEISPEGLQADLKQDYYQRTIVRLVLKTQGDESQEDLVAAAIAKIEGAIAAHAKKARDGKIALDDLQGGTFTITNLGGIGGTGFTPGYARLVTAARTHGVELLDLRPVLGYYNQREIFLGGRHVPIAEWPEHPGNFFPKDARETPPWGYLPRLTARLNPLKTADAWQSPEHAELDIPYHDWLRQHGVSDDIIRMTYGVEPSHGNTAFDVSALMLLFVSRFAAVQSGMSRPGESPIVTAKGGNQAIPEAMASALRNEVELGRDVVAIDDRGDRVEVRCSDGRIYTADHVVCSIPCPVLRRVEISPPMPPQQARAVQTLDSQIINLVHMVADRPFWEEEGLSPNMFSDGLVSNLVGEHKGADPADVTSLTAWIRGHKAAFLDQIPEAEARTLVLSDIARQRPASKGRLEIVEYKSWYRDRFSAGDWAVWQPGQVNALAPHVGKAHGRIHFCGEHTAIANRGMEGAMESGERAAIEVAALM